jgi:U3 small nucleolar RNA-associated protein 22
MASSDDAYSGSSSDEGSEVDQPGLTMMSDEDMEGGFDDLEEGGELNGGQYEDSDGDEDDFEDLEAEAEEVGKTAKRKGAKSKEALYAPPTNEEMQGLRETGELFKSNVIKLQVSKTTGRSS